MWYRVDRAKYLVPYIKARNESWSVLRVFTTNLGFLKRVVATVTMELNSRCLTEAPGNVQMP
jgi:hypothetical protein